MDSVILRESLATYIEKPSLKSLEKLVLGYVKEAEEAHEKDTEHALQVGGEKSACTPENVVAEAELQETNE